MASENVELLRSGYAAWSEGGIEAALTFMDERIEWVQDPTFPGAATYHGHDGVRRWAATMDESWERLDFEPGEVIDAGTYLDPAKGYEAIGR